MLPFACLLDCAAHQSNKNGYAAIEKNDKAEALPLCVFQPCHATSEDMDSREAVLEKFPPANAHRRVGSKRRTAHRRWCPITFGREASQREEKPLFCAGGSIKPSPQKKRRCENPALGVSASKYTQAALLILATL
jgi:hypothetical protein